MIAAHSTHPTPAAGERLTDLVAARFRLWFRVDAEQLANSLAAVTAFYGGPFYYAPVAQPSAEAVDSDEMTPVGHEAD